jgi:hypothetical protein
LDSGGNSYLIYKPVAKVILIIGVITVTSLRRLVFSLLSYAPCPCTLAHPSIRAGYDQNTITLYHDKMSNGDELDRDAQMNVRHVPDTAPDTRGAGASLRPEAGIARVRPNENLAITQMGILLDDTNWTVWRERMSLTLQLCGVDEYAKGRIARPDPGQDPVGSANWHFNDSYAQTLITRNVAATEKGHISQSATARDMWANLEVVHELKRHQTLVSCMLNLFKTVADEGDDIIEHLDKLNQYWEGIKLMGGGDSKISDMLFKDIIAFSLPPSWVTFEALYVGGVIDQDPRRLITSQQMIGALKEEYLRRELLKYEDGYVF